MTVYISIHVYLNAPCTVQVYVHVHVNVHSHILYMYVLQACCMGPEYTCVYMFSLSRVAPTERIKLSISKVTVDQYERMHSDIQELRQAGMPRLFFPPLFFCVHVHNYTCIYIYLLTIPPLQIY